MIIILAHFSVDSSRMGGLEEDEEEEDGPSW